MFSLLSISNAPTQIKTPNLPLNSPSVHANRACHPPTPGGAHQDGHPDKV
ncbi:MAG: hypothetical protein C5S44_00565, partial [Candidatus Methanocomedens sp.]